MTCWNRNRNVPNKHIIHTAIIVINNDGRELILAPALSCWYSLVIVIISIHCHQRIELLCRFKIHTLVEFETTPLYSTLFKCNEGLHEGISSICCLTAVNMTWSEGPHMEKTSEIIAKKKTHHRWKLCWQAGFKRYYVIIPSCPYVHSCAIIINTHVFFNKIMSHWNNKEEDTIVLILSLANCRSSACKHYINSRLIVAALKASAIITHEVIIRVIIAFQSFNKINLKRFFKRRLWLCCSTYQYGWEG